MDSKCTATLVLLASLMAVAIALPYSGHAGHGHHGGGGSSHHGGGGSSHQSVHLVSHDDGHDEGHSHGHGHESHGHGHESDGHDSHAEYDFKYGVSDGKTGDHKEHSETRDGHKVSGHYGLIDADGHKRTVYYTADKHAGFQATVVREPTAVKVPAPEHSGHHGGHAKLVEHSSQGLDHHAHHDHHGYGGHHAGGSSSHSYSLKQDHGSQGHGASHHGYGHHH